MRLASILIAGAAALTLTACSDAITPPDEQGTCFHVVAEGEEARFNVVARDQESIELCAARLEEMRVSFLRLGGSVQDITGAYNGQFIFIDRAGIWLSANYDGGRFFFLARTGDGRLAIPGVIVRTPAQNQPAS